MELQKELNRIQRELKAPKSQHNSFGNYNYRNAEDILNAYKKVAGETVLTISDEIIQVGERYYVKAVAKLSLGDENAQATAYAREPLSKKGMDEAQITGATSSYARKYAMNALFAIDDTKDAGSSNNTDNKPDTSEVEKKLATIKDIVELRKYFTQMQGSGKEVMNLITARAKQMKSEKQSDVNDII